MTAAPRPDPDSPDPAEAEGWALLDGLRRRLDDQGAQARKTATQVQQLADSIAALVSAQRRRTRWLNLNSFVAYLIFTLLLGVAFYHGQIGMRVVIEDYIHKPLSKNLLLILNLFVCWLGAVIGVFSILKVAFGGGAL